MISTRWDQILGLGQTEVVKRNGEKGAPEHQPPASPPLPPHLHWPSPLPPSQHLGQMRMGLPRQH